MEEKVDILIATYNGEKFIKQQIDSVLRSNISKYTNYNIR